MVSSLANSVGGEEEEVEEEERERNEYSATREPKPDLPSPRYQEDDVPFTRSPGTYFCVQPLYAPRIHPAFRNSLLAFVLA